MMMDFEKPTLNSNMNHMEQVRNLEQCTYSWLEETGSDHGYWEKPRVTFVHILHEIAT